jgi:hypothetical protein
MSSRGSFLSAFVLAAALSGIAGDAAAQLISNKPFEFSRRGGGGVGMSLGYRQAIIEEKLFNRRPENLLRDATGALLEVERGPSNQAFARQQASPFLPGASAGVARSGGSFSVFGGGAGIGFSIGGVGIGAGIGLEYGLLDSGGTLVSYSSPASSPIDGWISQLYSGHSDAS